MKKRGRRERRESQAARALQAGDISALEARIEQSPERAARGVIRALLARPSDPAQAEALDAMAARLAKRLRLSSKAAAALEVAAAGGRRSAGLRMEEALAAFALGQDQTATAIASQDAQVEAVLGPLLRAVRGDTPPPGSTSDPPELRALQQAARAVAQAVRGEPEKAREELGRIAPPLEEMMLAGDLGAAVDLGSPARVMGAVARLGGSLEVRASRALREAIVAELCAHGHEATLEALLTKLPGVTPEELERAQLSALRPQLAAAGSPAAAASLLRSINPSLFPPSAQAAASLYRGFGLLHDDPGAAVRWFERTIALGGDLVEAIRGKLLALLALEADASVVSDRGRSAARLSACAADRLAKAFGREGRGRALAAAAATLAAEAWLRSGDLRATEASARQARAFGAVGIEIEVVEVTVLGKRDPEAARARVDAILAQHPKQMRAWALKLGLAEREQDTEAILMEAAEATGDPMFAEMAAEMRAWREEDEDEDEDEDEMALPGRILAVGRASRVAGRGERGG